MPVNITRRTVEKLLVVIFVLVYLLLVYVVFLLSFNLYFTLLVSAIVAVCLVSMTAIGLWQEKKGEVWHRFAAEMGLYCKGRAFPSMWGNYRNRHVEISLMQESTDEAPRRYTEYRVEFENPKGILMSVYRESFFRKVGKAFGMQDIELNDPEFDQKFVVMGNDENAVKTVLEPSIRSKMMKVKNFRMVINRREPNAAYSQQPGLVTDIARLRYVLDTMIDVVEKIEKG